MPFYCLTQMIYSCVVLCDHRDAASSISPFSTLAVTDLLSTRIFIIPTHWIFISFMIQNTIRQLSFCAFIRLYTPVVLKHFFFKLCNNPLGILNGSCPLTKSTQINTKQHVGFFTSEVSC